MTYDELTAKIARIERVIDDIDSQKGNRHRDIDKCGLSFHYMDREKKLFIGPHHHFSEANIRFDAYAGRYGSSGVSNRMSEQLADYVVAALNDIKPAIIDRAIELARKEIKELAEKAAEEANKIQKLANPEQVES